MRKLCFCALIIMIFSCAIKIRGENMGNNLSDYIREDGTVVKHYESENIVQMPNQYFETKFQSRAVWVATV